MPELPEIEVGRRDLEREAAGRKVKSVDVLDKSVVARQKTKADFVKRLEGKKIKSFDRRGPFILGKLDSDEFWVVNLGEHGRLIRHKSGKAPTDPAIKLAVAFTQGGSVYLADIGDTAESFVASREELNETADFADMGIDPLENPVPWQQFGQLLLRSGKQKLKAVLQNPKVVAGLGPIYSDEVLFGAGLRFDRTPETLSAHEVRRLYRAMVETLMAAIKARGVSLEDTDVDMFGEPGQYGADLKVFQRAGLTCARCRGTVEKARFQKRFSYYCPGCQS